MFNRRQLLKSASAAALLSAGRVYGQTQPEKKPKFLIVIGATGGCSLIDSFLAIRRSEAGRAAPTLNCFPDEQVKSIDGTEIRAVDSSGDSVGAIGASYTAIQSEFVRKRKNDLMIVTQTGTSVNHTIAQKRALTGNEAWNGRTLQEAVAAEYGAGFALPNVNMAGDGYIQHGTDRSLPSWALNEPVANALLWPLSLDGVRGLKDVPAGERLALARRIRDEKLEPKSIFQRKFQKSEALGLWRRQRMSQQQLEVLDLITKLNIQADSPATPLGQYGLAESPDGARVREVFPRFLTDALEAQAALAFLLIKNRISVTVTIAPSFSVVLDVPAREVVNPPLAFDFSHNAHRAAQAIMWARLLNLADRLIGLLESEEYEDGESFWDRSMIYFATEFGRSKQRPRDAEEFSSAHDLNNGVAIVSPLANGNKILGGVDPATGLTYGYDPEDPRGVPRPGTEMQEKLVYAGILHALGVDTSGSALPDARALRRNV